MKADMFDVAIGSGEESRPVDSRVTYREFRAQVLAQCREEFKRRHSVHAMHPIRALRAKILAFREYLSYYGTGKFDDQDVAKAYLVRALGLKPDWSFSLSWRQVWLCRLMRCLRGHVVLRLVQPWIAQARSYQSLHLPSLRATPVDRVAHRL